MSIVSNKKKNIFLLPKLLFISSCFLSTVQPTDIQSLHIAKVSALTKKPIQVNSDINYNDNVTMSETLQVSGDITGNLIGNATSATTTTSFSGNLSGDVVGPQNATVVSRVAGVVAASVASGASDANAATSSNSANTIVKRNTSGGFSADSATLNHLSTSTISPSSGSVIIINGNVGVMGSLGIDVLDLLSSDTLLVDGNMALASDKTLFVDHIHGESNSGVKDITVIDLTVNGEFNNPSDRRIKTDISDLDNNLCLALVNQMVPHEYNYVPAVRKAMGDNGSRHVGFIAQELANVDPRFVSIAAGKQALGNLTIEDLARIKQELFLPIIIGALKAEDKKVVSKAEAADLQELKNRVKALEALMASKNL